MSMFWATCYSKGAGPIVQPDYISRWKLDVDAGGGTVADSGTQGTTLQSVGTGGTFVPGVDNNAWQSNNSELLSSESGSLATTYLTNSITMSVWIKPSSVDLTGIKIAFQNHYFPAGPGNPSNNGAYVGMRNGDFVATFMMTNTESYTDSNGRNTTNYAAMAYAVTPPIIDAWTSVIGVYDKPSKTVKIYINGVLETTTTTSQTPNFNSTTRSCLALSGQRFILPGASTGYIDNGVDDVRHYNRILSDAEILSIYNEFGS